MASSTDFKKLPNLLSFIFDLISLARYKINKARNALSLEKK